MKGARFMMVRMRRRFGGFTRAAMAPGLVALTALVLASARPASADVVQWDAAGTPSGATGPASVSAIFTQSGTTLTIQLLNKLAGTDPTQVLTGLLFNVNGTAPGSTSLTSANADSPTSKIWDTSSSQLASTELRNSVLGGGDGWQYAAPPGSYNGNNYQFGLGASGLGGTFGGLGNENWGIIGPGSPLSQSNLNNKLPLVMSMGTGASSATFVISGFNLPASAITGVTFAFASTNSVALSGRVVPEPASVALMGLGLGGAGLFGWRRRSAAKART